MKLAHQIKLSVFSMPEDDEEKVRNALISLVPYDLGKEKIKLKQYTAIGFQERKIRIFEILLEKQKHTSAFLKTFFKKLTSEQNELLIRQKESRFDTDFNFFIRLQKEKLLNGEYFITDSGNCFHIRISVAVFPSKREKGLEVVGNIIK